MKHARLCLALLAAFSALAAAQPYFYDDYSYYDMYDEYDLYNMHYNYDFFDDDYAGWDDAEWGKDWESWDAEGSQDGAASQSTGAPGDGGDDKWQGTEDDYYFDHPYFSYYDDVYGDYSFDDPFEFEVDCVLDEKKEPKFEGIPACDLVLEGADKAAGLLTGGVDGTYKVYSCENGRPLYKREKSPKGEDRVLWYSSTFRDWDLNNGTSINEEDILMYGGQGDSELRPQFVPGQWHIASDLVEGYSGMEDYIAFDLTLKCADGSEIEAPAQAQGLDLFGNRPLLTDAEMEEQYKVVYKRAVKRSGQGDISLGLVSLFVFIGLAIVFGLPFMVARSRRGRGGRAGRASRGAGAAGRAEGGGGGFKISSLMASNKKNTE